MHALEPMVDAKVPTRQLEQTLADALEYWPVSQVPVMAEPPVQYDPAGHEVTAIRPVEAQYVPLPQIAQLEAPMLIPKYPAAQFVHELVPVVGANEPATQFKQLKETVAPEVGRYVPLRQLVQLVEPVFV
jgi:hypothetical protein